MDQPAKQLDLLTSDRAETGACIGSDLEGWWVADAAPAGGEHAQRKDCSDAGKGDGAGDYPDDG